MYRIVSPSRPSAVLSFTKVWAWEGVSERRWRSAANRPSRQARRGWAAVPALYFQRGTSPPLYPPTGESTPPYPLLRGGAPVSAAASVGPGRCPPGTRTPLAPPKGPLTHGLPQRGSHKQYPPSLTPSAAPGVTEGVSPKIPQGEAQKNFPVRPGCASKIPERPLWRNFPCPHESSFANAQLTRPKTPAGLFARADCPPRKIVLY